jgi:GT2 family glycosyltransferase
MLLQPSGAIDASYAQISLISGKPRLHGEALNAAVKCGRSGTKLVTYAGANLLATKSALVQAGGFSDYFLYYDEADLVMRFDNAGLAIHVLPTFIGIHGRAQSTGDLSKKRSSITTYYATKYSIKFARDHVPFMYPVFVAARVFYCLSLVLRGQPKPALSAAKALIGRRP